MLTFAVNHPLLITNLIYGTVFILLALVEYFLPLRPPVFSRLKRWPQNLSLFILGTLLIQLITTTAIANLAYIAWKNHWGLLNQFSLNPWVAFFISFLVLDIYHYSQHVLFHKISIAWRIHRTHHADVDVDVTSSQRFHPFETLMVFVVRQAFVLVFGPFYLSVIVFDFTAEILGFITHANIRIPISVDRLVRYLFITPDMHRIHHSVETDESNSNFGGLLSWWDYLFNTYKAAPKQPREKMVFGLPEFRSARYFKFHWILAFPFLNQDDPSK